MLKQVDYKNLPLVSVVTVTLNSEKHLEGTIKSVLGQTYPKIEYIIIDGGSEDGTLGIIEKYRDKIAYFVSEPDRGLYDAMNKGIEAARGELIGLLNSDDWYQPKAVELIVAEYLKDKEAGVFFGDIELVSENPEYRERTYGRPELIGTFRWRVVHPSSFVKKDVYARRRYNLDYGLLADVDLFFCLYFSGVKFHYCPEIITYMRTGGKSSGYRTPLEEYKIRSKYFGKRYFFLNVVYTMNSILKRFVVGTLLRNNFNSIILQVHRKIFHRGG